LAIVSLTAWGAACAFAGCGGDDTTGSSTNNDSGVPDSSTTLKDSGGTDSAKADTGTTVADSGGGTDSGSGSADSGSADSGATDSGAADSGDGGVTTLSFATDIYPILVANCVGCHILAPNRGGGLVGQLVLGDVGDAGDGGFTAVPDEALAYSNLVNKPAQGTGVPENPADSGITYTICNTLGGPGDGGPLPDGAAPLLRVKPGDHASSLCWLKVEAREADGGPGNPPCGEGMPLGPTPLSQANVDKLAAWIDQGAKP
jgi:hypothetical protein